MSHQQYARGPSRAGGARGRGDGRGFGREGFGRGRGWRGLRGGHGGSGGDHAGMPPGKQPGISYTHSGLGSGGGTHSVGYGRRPAAPQVLAPRYIPNPKPAPGGPGPKIAPGVRSLGVRRPATPGTLGTPLTVTTNNFAVTIPKTVIHHYDEIKADNIMPAKFNMDLIRVLQERVAPAVFTPRAVYDGRKNLFASRRLRLSGENSQTFDVTLEPAREGATPPKVYRVTLKHVAEIDPTALSRYQKGQHSYDNTIITALTAINVVIQMEPIMSATSGTPGGTMSNPMLYRKYPHNSRSFFTDKETWAIGGGLELWRGYFQSVRPGLRSVLMNIDISTGTMFAPGPMVDVCRAILGNNSPNALVPGQGLSDRERLKLKNFLSNVRFTTTQKEGSEEVSAKPKTLKKISNLSAANYKFKLHDGSETTVVQYFQSMGTTLQYPNYVCIETSIGAPFPIELCNIIPGQLMKKQIPPDFVSSVLSFSVKAPKQRLDSIVAGHAHSREGSTTWRICPEEYLRQFGITISTEPERCLARVLPTPALNYGAGSKRKHIKPANGSWNLVDQKFFKPATVTGWAVVVYDTRTVREPDVLNIVRNFKAQADLLGIKGLSPNPPISYPPPKSLDVHNHLHAAGNAVYKATKRVPTLIVIIMPDNSSDLYQAVKYFGDVKRGVPTQCLNAFKAKKGNPQYFANVWLKVNAKLGGVNSVLDPQAQKLLSDPARPAMIIAADVMHAAPGSTDRPSFISVVGSIDSTAAQYSAVSATQDPR
ncbi:argonaute-like protein [Ceratobasidium sp. AG-Ba]|nr:argonaute-like protein [Ceratobasidium sp. AG-Ba]